MGLLFPSACLRYLLCSNHHHPHPASFIPMSTTPRSPSLALREFSELVASALDLSFSTPTLASFSSSSPPDSPRSPVSPPCPTPYASLPVSFYHIPPGTRSESRLGWILAQRDASPPFDVHRESFKSSDMPLGAKPSSKAHPLPEGAPHRPRSPFPLSLIPSRPPPTGEAVTRSKTSFKPSKYFPSIRKKPS